jgi:GNAT superfamily N-acetyltransferase
MTCERYGFAPMAAVRPPTFARFSLEDDADGLWVAEDVGEIVGFAFSWVCGDLWFLAQPFVSPDRQGCGVGPALLDVIANVRPWHGTEVADAATFLPDSGQQRTCSQRP